MTLFLLDDLDDLMDEKSICRKCRHFNYDKLFCKAFPENDGIPTEILTGEFDHTVKHPDQKNDIVFEPIEEKK